MSIISVTSRPARRHPIRNSRFPEAHAGSANRLTVTQRLVARMCARTTRGHVRRTNPQFALDTIRSQCDASIARAVKAQALRDDARNYLRCRRLWRSFLLLSHLVKMGQFNANELWGAKPAGGLDWFHSQARSDLHPDRRVGRPVSLRHSTIRWRWLARGVRRRTHCARLFIIALGRASRTNPYQAERAIEAMSQKGYCRRNMRSAWAQSRCRYKEKNSFQLRPKHQLFGQDLQCHPFRSMDINGRCHGSALRNWKLVKGRDRTDCRRCCVPILLGGTGWGRAAKSKAGRISAKAV